MLTRVQAMFLDGPLLLEQTGRHRSGRVDNFNGPAGICVAHNDVCKTPVQPTTDGAPPVAADTATRPDGETEVPVAYTNVAALQQAESYLLTQMPIAPIYWGSRTTLIAPSVRGWKKSPLGFRNYKDVWLEGK